MTMHMTKGTPASDSLASDNGYCLIVPALIVTDFLLLPVNPVQHQLCVNHRTAHEGPKEINQWTKRMQGVAAVFQRHSLGHQRNQKKSLDENA